MSHVSAEENALIRTNCPLGEARQVPHDCEPLLTEKQLSDWLGISLPTLQRLRSTGRGPRFVQLSERRIAYRRSVVQHWLNARTCTQIGDLPKSERLPLAALGEDVAGGEAA